MTKKAYMKPTMKTVILKHRSRLMAGSVDTNGMNRNLQSNSEDEVDSAW